MFNLKSIMAGGGFRRDGLKYYTGPVRQSHLVAPGSVLVAMTDVTQRREVLASPLRVPESAQTHRATFSTDLSCARVKAGSPLSSGWCYHLFASTEFLSYARGFANGTTVLHLDRAGILGFPIAVPPSDAVKRFSDLVEQVHLRADLAHEEVRLLTALRDLLLPKLISGEIRIPDAEKLVGEVS